MKFSSPSIEYINNLYVSEDEALLQAKDIMKGQNLAIQIGPEEGKLISILAKMISAKNIVEIGTLAGYSSVWLARSLPDDGLLITIESNPLHADIAKQIFKQAEISSKIELKLGKAEDILPTINKQIDLVFIDADKKNYPLYLAWAKKHLRIGGIVIADNSLLFGHLYKKPDQRPASNTQIHAMQTFNNMLARDPDFMSIIIPTYEGLALGLKVR